MNHKCFFHLFDIAILQYICKTKRSVICGKKYIFTFRIFQATTLTKYSFFSVYQKTKIYVQYLKKKLMVLTKFCAIWIHIQYSSEIQDFSSLYWQVVERQDHCVINNILSHVQSSKVGEEMYNSHHSYSSCSIYHYSEIYLLHSTYILQVGS